ncbi:MAG: YdcF family protein [Pseudomonadota bacterium]
MARRLVRWSFGLTAAAVVLFLLGFIVFVTSIHRAPPITLARADGIVVLTGGTERIRRGLQLLQRDRARRLLISGVNRRTSRDAIAERTPGFQTLFRCCVDVGYRAQNTIGNARETRDWARNHSFDHLIVVTSSYHMPRSLAELHSAMPGMKLTPYPVIPASVRAEAWYANPGTAKLLFWEYTKFVAALGRFCLKGIADIASPNADSEGAPVVQEHNKNIS